MGKRFRWILAGACALLAVLCAVAYGEEVRTTADAERAEALARFGGEATPVLVASRALEAGTLLDAACCEERLWPSELVPEGCFGSLEEAQGQELTSPVSAGLPITATALRRSQDLLEVPSGEVALTVPLTERTGVAADVSQGALLAAYRVEEGSSRLLSARATVLGVSPTGLGSSASLTVSVPVEDVTAVMAASADGTLRLVRPAGDVTALGDHAAGGDVEPSLDTHEAGDVEPTPTDHAAGGDTEPAGEATAGPEAVSAGDAATSVSSEKT